jgi:hypothetical protein
VQIFYFWDTSIGQATSGSSNEIAPSKFRVEGWGNGEKEEV